MQGVLAGAGSHSVVCDITGAVAVYGALLTLTGRPDTAAAAAQVVFAVQTITSH